jgi:hypothetical protein
LKDVRTIYAASYATKITMHQLSYVIYVAFQEKEGKEEKEIQVTPPTLSLFVIYYVK